jgi:hypothetical protein
MDAVLTGPPVSETRMHQVLQNARMHQDVNELLKDVQWIK